MSDPEIYGWRGDDPFLSRLNAEKVEIARKSGSNMYVHLKDYERLRAALEQCNEYRDDPHKIIGVVDAALAGMPPYVWEPKP